MKQEKIQSPVEQVPFADLYISELNPRSVVNADSIEALAKNIRQLGLIQNLAGLRDDAGKIGIVAGGRRYRALAMLQDDPRFAFIPVRIAPDQATAEVWASTENHHREQPHPADEIREYGGMAERGIPVPSIAVAFGVSEAHVYRRLKLAGLPVEVLDALKANEISLSNAAAFTISDDLKVSLEVLERVRGDGYSDHQIKQMLKPDSVSSTDRRAVFVGQEEYQAEGGRITSDLFAERTYIDDVDLLNDLFTAKLDAATKAMTADGWKWAEALTSSYVGYHEIEDRKLERARPEQGELTEEQSARFDELAELAEAEALDAESEAELASLQAILDGIYTEAQKNLSGVLIHVQSDGILHVTEGLVKREDRAAAIEAGFLRESLHGNDTAPKSPISQKLRDDLNHIAQGARQHALLRYPDLLLDLLAYQLSHSLNWQNPIGISLNDVPNFPSTEAEGYALDDRLTSDPPREMYGKDLGKSFRAFRKKGAEHSRGELIRFLASQYRGGSAEITTLIDKETQPDIREVWTPTAENFFSRVGGPYLNELWRDLLDLSEDHPKATSFAKLKKSEKATKLETLFSDADMREAHGVTEKQAERIGQWLPEGMA